MLEILGGYSWTGLSLRIIEAIGGQFFHMVMHVFDGSSLSQGIFAVGAWGAVVCFLGHGGKHILTILLTIWRPDSKHDRGHVPALLVRDCCCRGHALPCEKTMSWSLLLSSLGVWSVHGCLGSPALSRVCLSLAF